MGKEARNEDLDLTPEEQKHFQALLAMLADRDFGKDGPPRETTFSGIEQFGHQAGWWPVPSMLTWPSGTPNTSWARSLARVATRRALLKKVHTHGLCKRPMVK